MIHKIYFNKSNYQDKTIGYFKKALETGHTSGDGLYTKLCSDFIEKKTLSSKVLITHSCTAALEISALLLDAEAGDEVIMPSFTFVSTANAFVLRGLKPVFVDVRDDNCNIDEELIEQSITPKTRAIVVMHYSGVACNMDVILDIAKRHNLMVIEDAAQAYNSYYKGKHLGSLGDLGTFSFHETKNIISGEGGALLINRTDLIDRSHIIREKGTNRRSFLDGLTDKYTWVDVGSSYLPSDLISAYLYSNLEIADDIHKRRVQIWDTYYKAFKYFADGGYIKLPFINEFATNNGHIFYIRFKAKEIRDAFIKHMKDSQILTPFHYVPLHSSPAGLKFGRVATEMSNTEVISETLVRLPIFYTLSNNELDYIIEKALEFLKKNL